MDRWACVDIPRFLLQIRLRQRSELRGQAVAIVTREVYQAPLVELSPPAARAGLRRGMKAPAASALCPGLHVEYVSEGERDEARELVLECLRSFSPRVEPSPLDGSFLADPMGLGSLFGSESRWGREIVGSLVELGFRPRLAIASMRVAAIALARSPGPPRSPGSPGGADLPSSAVFIVPPGEEHAYLERRPLSALGLDETSREALARLGILSVGDFLRLPPGSLSRRFGEDLARLFRALHGQAESPLAPCPPRDSYESRIEVEPATDDASRLLFAARQALPALLARLATGGQALGGLHITLSPGGGGGHRLEPARPCLDDLLLCDLLRLHLDSLRLSAPAASIVLRAEPVPAAPDQIALFARREGADLDALARALARIRAAYGAEAAVVAKLTDDHRPERGYRWEPATRLSPRPENLRAGAPPTVVRAVHDPPLAHRAPPGPALAGPFRVEGGWWERPYRHGYHFLRSPEGRLSWGYHDELRGRWFSHGDIAEVDGDERQGPRPSRSKGAE